MTDISNFLRRCGLFRDFDDTRLNTISQSADEVTFDAGVDILREGEPGDVMYVILTGEVQVYTRNVEGREVTLARHGAGDHFGEQALLPGGTGRRYASVRAVGPVRLARVPKPAFQSVLADDDVLHERLVEIGEEQVRSNLQKLSPLARSINLNTVGRLRRNLSPGEILFRQGDEADALYFVNVGRLSVWREENGARTLIGFVERSGCVGELAFVKKSRRTETVIAEDVAEVTGVVRAAFDEVYTESSGFRDYLATLHHSYEFPRRGIITQHNGTFAGHECVTTLYHLNDGRLVAAYRVVGQALYAVESLGAGESQILAWHNNGQWRELRVDESGTVVGLTARGEWPDVHIYHLFVLDGGRISLEQRRQFLRTGSFRLKRDGGDIVCHCVHISGDTIRAAIRQGAISFNGLQEVTGCGSVCGGCVPVIAEMLGTEEWISADVVAEREEAPGIRSFELAPRDPSYPEAMPGQHIVVEGLVDGLRLRRPYTLSSARRHGGRLRITVKREEGGAFSGWLFDNRRKEESLRITRPRGEFIIDPANGPAVCLVAGIGVTPALAFAATVSKDREKAHSALIHYSGRSRERMACIAELEAAAEDGRIELIVHETSCKGRLDDAEIAKLAGRYAAANWYVCGPESYLRDIPRLLKQARVGSDRIHTETFTPVGTPKVTNEEREAFKRYVLVKPQRAPNTPVLNMVRRTGKILHALANTRINPLRWIENRFARRAGLDATLPLEYFAIAAAFSWGPYEYQMQVFRRLGNCDTFVYWMPRPPFVKFPDGYRVDTGWTQIADKAVVPVYVTRSRSAMDHLLRRAADTDRGALPNYYFQQLFGRTDTAACPGRKPAGLFAGQIHDNSTWTDDRALAVELFGFTAIDYFGAGMAAAAEQVCEAIDEVMAHDPDAPIDLNVMMSKVAYTIIVRAVFGDVDLAEMHALGRTLSESIRQGMVYLWEFVMGRQSIPEGYLHAFNGSRKATKRMIDLLRDLDRRGKLTEKQRAAPVVRLVLETAEESGGAYERLFTLVLPIIIGGHETTGHAMSWTFYELARNPKLEAQLLAEIETFRAAHGGRPISTQDYDERPLSWALLAETLRRHTPLPATSRTTLREGAVPPDPKTGSAGFHFPAGAMIVFSFVGAHLDPARWNDPYEFQPQRWFEGVREEMSLAEKGKIVRANIRAREQALDWLPFSDGPARCAGQHFNAHEVFVILDSLLPRYRFELVHPEETIPYSDTIVVGPAQGRLAVRIRRRASLFGNVLR
jgi:ferredoxin-NADP reductase/cytochrome P450/CRP-like cAMP-binding protein